MGGGRRRAWGGGHAVGQLGQLELGQPKQLELLGQLVLGQPGQLEGARSCRSRTRGRAGQPGARAERAEWAVRRRSSAVHPAEGSS